MKPHIYRPGDKVRIVNPKFVRRVGYPLVWYEVSDEQLYAGYHHGSGWDADYAPGGLEDMKVHTLLKLSDSVELEACNVEPA